MNRALLLSVLLGAPAFANVYWLDGAFMNHRSVGWEVEEVERFTVFAPFGAGAHPEYDDGDPEKPKEPVGDELKPTFKGPQGSTLSISVKASNTDANWKGGDYTANFALTATVTRNGKSYAVALPGSLHSISAVWSPDGRRLLLSCSKDDDHDAVSFIVPGAFPRVQVLYPPKKPLDEKAINLIDALSAKAGAVISFAGEAKKARPASVIYFAKDNEAEAKALAATLPGGATTEPLTWETTANVVIAIGDSFAVKK
ncbi:MAG: LytR C-terminal domain-containing protein [Archangium sp.]